MRMSKILEEVAAPFSRPGLRLFRDRHLRRKFLVANRRLLVIASPDEALRVRLQSELSTPRFRLYTNSDRTGVELGGAVKNIIAIAAGVADGLGLGSNATAALVTRGLAEITRLVVACGGRRETLAGSRRTWRSCFDFLWKPQPQPAGRRRARTRPNRRRNHGKHANGRGRYSDHEVHGSAGAASWH